MPGLARVPPAGHLPARQPLLGLPGDGGRDLRRVRPGVGGLRLVVGAVARTPERRATARPADLGRGSGDHAMFPTGRRPRRSSSARATSSSGYSVGWTGSMVPPATMASRSANSARCSSACCMAQMPQSMPTTVRLRRSTWLSGTEGMGPLANPMTRYRALVAQGAERRLGQRTAHGVDDEVHAGSTGPGPRRVLHRLGRRVEDRLRPRGQRSGAFSSVEATPSTRHRGPGPRRWRPAPRHRRRRGRAQTRPAGPRPAHGGRRGRCCSSG